MARDGRLLGLLRLLIGCSVGLVLAMSSGNWRSATAQAPVPQQPAADPNAAPKKPDSPKAPVNPTPTPTPYSMKKGLSLEYWTVRDPKTDAASLAGMQLAPPPSSLVVTADNTAGSFEALLVTMEFRFDKASKVYVLRAPIALKDGQYEISAGELTEVITRLIVDLNAALPIHFDPTKPLPLSKSAKVHFTPIVRASPADPLAKDQTPKFVTAAPFDLSVGITLKRKLGPDEKRP
jgi:hypothetical protein